MNYPRIYLVLDNCFAIKRWVKPTEWMEISRDLGFKYVQASTDNEIDPLFCTDDYMDGWFEEVKTQQKKLDMQLVNFYTGYQTYRTVGLAHYDSGMREKITNGWIKKLIVKIADLKAKGLGFSFFAIPHAVLQDPAEYKKMMGLLIAQMADIAAFAHENGRVQVSYEQMYAPHQPPFTIKGTLDFIKSVYEINHKPSYVTIDAGHMVGQKKFRRPSKKDIMDALAKNKAIWLGSDAAQIMFEQAAGLARGAQISEIADRIEADISAHEYLFSEAEDSDVYQWLYAAACYSPIMHLQQTDGITSSHAAFTPDNNKRGIIQGDRLLAAIKKSYEQNNANFLQQAAEDIYLSFEIFASNTETGREIIAKLRQTIAYWRRWVPEDGMKVSELI